jgi:DNA invertase Pin-like site-specific DNA recombinase
VLSDQGSKPTFGWNCGIERFGTPRGELSDTIGLATMLIGYVRLSEHEKPADLDAQRRALTAYGVEKMFTGQATLKGPQAARDACLGFMREGDTLVVSRPDRIARTPAELLKIADALTKRGVGLVVLSGFGPKLDTRDRSSEPLLTALRGVAAWDRALKRELQRAGIERARLADPSKYAGGKKRVSAGAIQALAADGFGPSRIARILGINRETVRTYLGPDYRAPRKPPYVPRQPIDAGTIQVLLASGVGPTRIAASLGCSRTSVYRLSGRW